jgi:hypothetical protein
MHRVPFLRVMMIRRMSRLCLGRWRFGVGCWMFAIFSLRHQFQPAFPTFAGVVLHHFGMHYAGILGGFRFRSLRQER